MVVAWCGSFSALWCAPAAAQIPVPRLTNIFPLGAKQGTTVELTLGGDKLDDPTALYFSHPGIKAEWLPAVDKQPRKVRVTVDSAVPIGGYDVRFVGRWGASNPRTFTVGDGAECEEQEPNNDREHATRIQLNSTVNGRIGQSEDVDWLVFTARRGERLIVDCQAWRIDSRLDGFIWLYDSSGRELAASQDVDLRDEKRDPFLDVEIPADGDYYLKLTDFVYAGSGDYFYRLSVGVQPYIDLVLPTGARRGQSGELRVFGRNLPGGKPAGVSIQGRPLEVLTVPWASTTEHDRLVSGYSVRPTVARFDGAELHVPSAVGSSNGRWIVASDLDETLEQEPNNDPAQAQLIKPGTAVSGQFDVAKDIDHFKFTGQKGRKYVIEVFGQSIASPVDPELELVGPKGNLIASATDNGENIGQLRFTSSNRDVRYELNAPDDGDYTLRVEHLYGQMQGGPQYVYRLELREQPAPDFRLVCSPPHDTRLDSHVVDRDGRQRLDVLVWRMYGHDAPIVVETRNLPAGVTCEPFTLGPGVKWGQLVLRAAADAPIEYREIEVVGRSEVDGHKVEHAAVGGGIVWDTVNTPAISRMSRSMVLAVRGEAPWLVSAESATGKIVEGEATIDLKVTVARHGEFKGPVELSAAGYELPRGLEVPLTTLPAGQNDVTLKVKTDKMKPGQYSFIVQGAAQTSYKDAAGNMQSTRAVYPSNPVQLLVEPKPTEAKK